MGHQRGHHALSVVRRHSQLSPPGEAVEARPLEVICALIAVLVAQLLFLFLRTPLNVPGSGTPGRAEDERL